MQPKLQFGLELRGRLPRELKDTMIVPILKQTKISGSASTTHERPQELSSPRLSEEARAAMIKQAHQLIVPEFLSKSR